MSTDRRTRAWIEVDAAAVRRNLGVIRKAVGPDAPLVPMVKADAYGLGVARAVAVLSSEGPWGYGVATVEEGRELRVLGVEEPILVFSPLPPDSFQEAVSAGLTLCLSGASAVQRLVAAAGRAGRTAEFHLEVDTGMGRAGVDWRRPDTVSELLEGLGGGLIRWTGCFTHFHSADGEASGSVERQWERFQDALRTLPLPDAEGFLVHACNSAAALRFPDLARGGVRPGIFLWGGSAGRGLPEPEPVASLRARVVLTRDAPPGTTLGYGATYAASGWERWATLAIGYGDGLPRLLGNRGHVLLRGRRLPIVGRISMDMTVVDITRAPGVEPGDVATLVGRDGDETISLEEVADHASTVNYEILTGLGPRLPRVWVDDGGR